MYNREALERDFGVDFIEDVFYFLEDLRESGATNMFGASMYIEEEFDMEKRDAEMFLELWMDEY